MAITYEKKGILVEEYVERLKRSQAVIVTEYRGLKVKQLQDLRRELRNHDSELVVGKNTLILRALSQVGMAAPKTLFKGPTSVTFCFKEVAGPAKALGKYARDSKIMIVKGGVMGHTAFDEAGVEMLSTLPSRDQALAQVLGSLQSPMSSILTVLAGPMRGLLNVLNARVSQLEGVGQPEGAGQPEGVGQLEAEAA